VSRVWVSSLRRKYRHPVRAIETRGCDYCVGGALCREVGMDHDFPNEQQLKDALLKANPKIDWYAISDSDKDYIYGIIHGVIEANDVGNFELSWRLLGRLLRMAPKVVME
jgi:hypothetical protein